MGKRIVVDANVFSCALMNPGGTPGAVVARLVQDNRDTLLLSHEITTELKRILFYPKVRMRVQHTDEELEMWLLSLQMIAHIVVPRFTYPVLVAEDPADDTYLIAAIEGSAHFIVSGDKHLLNLKTYQGIQILTPFDFLSV